MQLCKSIGIDFEGGQRAVPLESDKRGQNMSGPLIFLAGNTDFATRNPKFWTEIEPECDQELFFFFFGQFWTEIKFLSLTKLCKNISPPQKLFNQQKINSNV